MIQIIKPSLLNIYMKHYSNVKKYLINVIVQKSNKLIQNAFSLNKLLDSWCNSYQINTNKSAHAKYLK